MPGFRGFRRAFAAWHHCPGETIAWLPLWLKQPCCQQEVLLTSLTRAGAYQSVAVPATALTLKRQAESRGWRRRRGQL